jgi:hypothetical protein
MVKSEFRYIHDKNTKKFLDDVLSTSEKRVALINESEILWRARRGSVKGGGFKPPIGNKRVFQDDVPYSPEEMKPLSGKAKEGRANPKGIPCLYLATNMQTAIQEVRPWLGSHISVAQLQIVKDLRLIDCSKNILKLDGTGFNSPHPNLNDWQSGKLSNSEVEEYVWSCIDRAFSVPIDPSDDTADYIPTQILSEIFRSGGYDGIIYNSLFAEGKNVALFDVDSAKVLDCKLCQIINIPSFEFREVIPRSKKIIQNLMKSD